MWPSVLIHPIRNERSQDRNTQGAILLKFIIVGKKKKEKKEKKKKKKRRKKEKKKKRKEKKGGMCWGGLSYTLRIRKVKGPTSKVQVRRSKCSLKARQFCIDIAIFLLTRPRHVA